MATRLLKLIPGAGLLQRAYDATKLAGALMQHRRERALVLATERQTQMAQFKDANANKKLKELFEEKKYDEILMLYMPASVVCIGKEFVDFWWKVWDIYWIFVLLRIILVFMPQTGYIHPDEFFQTIEVITGDILGTDTIKTWEFNVTAPIRSMTLPFIVFGTPLYLAKGFDYILHLFTGCSLIGPYFVLVLPRFVMLVLSFTVDWCVYQICVLYRHNYNQCLTTLASSYVMLIYATRTFSNTLEMVLASFLFYLVAHCMKRTSETVYLQSMVHDAYQKAETIKEKVNIQKKNKLIPGHDFKYFLPISVICAFGIFNRPTFVVFAAVPLFFWFQRGVATHSFLTPFQMFNFRIVSIVPGFVVTCLLLLLSDSLYYGELTLRKLWNLDMNWTDWKCTPLHFVMYNAVPGNLDKHGTHPLYLHTLVNIPLLFGPLGIAAIFSAIYYFSEMLAYDWKHKPSVRNVYAMAMFTFVLAMALLSAIPHQEPRFIIPLIVPIVLMNSHKLRWKTPGKWKPLLTLWYAFNIFFILFYGFIHQGGVQGILSHVAKDQTFGAKTTDVNLVFSHVYMPPKFTLLQINPALRKAKEEAKADDWDYPAYFRKPNNLSLHLKDFAGKSLEGEVKTELLTLASQARDSANRIENFVILPTHLIDELEDCTRGTFFFKPVARIFPHITTENLPSIFEPLLPFIHFQGKLTPYDAINYFASFVSDVLDVIGQFSLSMYKFELLEGVKIVELNYTLSTTKSANAEQNSNTSKKTKKVLSNKV